MARLGDVFPLVRNGASIKQTDGAAGIPITRIETISNREIDRNKFGYADIIDDSKYKDYILQDGDILMSHINSEKHLGKVALYKKQGNEQIIHGMNLLMLRANPSVLFPPFAIYFFETSAFLLQIKKITKKSVNQASFTVKSLKEVEIPLPPIDEQRKIAAVLDKVSDLIAKRRQQLDKLDELVKSRFVEMFGDPVNNERGWQKALIPEVCHAIIGGGTPSKSHPEYFTGTIPWVSPKDMKLSVLSDSIDHITEEAIANSTTKLVPANSVLMVIRSGILKHSLPVAINSVPVTINQDMKAFVPNEVVTTAFLMHYFMAIENDVLSGVRSVTADNIDFKAFQKRKMIVPPLDLQQQFATFVAQVDKSKLAIQKSLEKLEILKKALMQKYFG